MCRLFGMSAGERRARATFWLLSAPDSLAAQSHREPDGTGLGWFDEHAAPQVRKQPVAAYGDRDFAQEARTVESSTFLAHIRFASTGALELRNTHPFEQEGRLFAHNGVIENLAELDAELGSARALVQGETDSERLFALITREIAARDGDVEGGIQAACSWVAANLPLLAINLILITAQGLWALRYPATHELHILERPAGEALEHASSLGRRAVHWSSWQASRWTPTRAGANSNRVSSCTSDTTSASARARSSTGRPRTPLRLQTSAPPREPRRRRPGPATQAPERSRRSPGAHAPGVRCQRIQGRSAATSTPPRQDGEPSRCDARTAQQPSR
jgi:glutamine amidotransferase